MTKVINLDKMGYCVIPRIFFQGFKVKKLNYYNEWITIATFTYYDDVMAFLAMKCKE